MRTVILVCIVALVVAVGVAYAVGLIAVDTEHSAGNYVVSLTVHTDMIHHDGTAVGTPAQADDFVEVTGKIASVRPDQSEVVVSENVKNWTFRLAKDGKVFINDRAATLAELQAGDDAAVTFDRQGEQLFAHVVRATRK